MTSTRSAFIEGLGNKFSEVRFISHRVDVCRAPDEDVDPYVHYHHNAASADNAWDKDAMDTIGHSGKCWFNKDAGGDFVGLDRHDFPHEGGRRRESAGHPKVVS